MALPTAQLGGFPNINVPSFVPVVETSKKPKLWEQVLAQVLAQAAGGALAQGTQNAMTKDWATESGEKPASFMQRVGRGPNVPQAEYVRRQGQKFDTEKMLAQAALTLGADSLASQPGARDVFAAREKELADISQQTAHKGDITAQSKMSRRAIRADNEREDARQIFETARDALRINADSELRASQTVENKARAARLQSQTDEMRFLHEQMRNAPGKDGLSPRQRRVQEAAAQKPLPDTGTTNILQEMFDELVREGERKAEAGQQQAAPVAPQQQVQAPAPTALPAPAISRGPGLTPGTPYSPKVLDYSQAEAQSLMRKIAQMRALMERQNEKGQSMTAEQIDLLLARLQALQSGPAVGQYP